MWRFTVSISRRTVVGAVLIGITVAVSSLGIVRAERDGITRDVKVYSCSSGSACLEGKATGHNTFGVWGNSSAGTGVQGNSSATNKNSGVAGISSATSGTGYGVYGRSSNGPGVYGTSILSNAIEGHNECCPGSSSYGTLPSAGVAGFGQTDGVMGVGNPQGESKYFGSSGVLGIAYGPSNWSSGIGNAAIQAYSGGGVDIFAGDSSKGGWCHIDALGNLTCKGTVIGYGTLRSRHRTESGRHVLTYASESATATVEDVGTARLTSGTANVQIEPAFASVIDHKWYYVFLTPMGDTRGLYVSMKTASGFQVRENQRGRSNVEFDYRIVAHPLDAKDDRLPDAPMQTNARIAMPGMQR
jgi:hypothetical protein